MQYTIHLKPISSIHSVIEHLNIIKFLRQKSLLAQLFSDRPAIKFTSSNPGIITHLKKKFGHLIVGIFSEKHGKGLYKRPTYHVTQPSPSAQPLTPIQVAKAYNFPAPGSDLKERLVAIIELGGGYDPIGVMRYCAKLGVASPKIIPLNVDGALPIPDPMGADGEVSLDIDVVAAVAPGVKILLIFAPNTTNGFIAAVSAAGNYPTKPDAISISWGAPEGSWDSTAMEALTNAIQTCVQKGIPVFVAAGDNGSSDGATGNNVDFPASSTASIACGGTKLILNPDGSRNSEVVWNEDTNNEGATGGGISTVYPNRKVPDIAGNADPESGYKVMVDALPSVIGGTSAVAPLFAGLTVLLASNTPNSVGNLKEVLYAHPEIYFDVVSGNNGAYSAGPGFDMCSGLGVPDGTKLLNVLKPSITSKIVKFLKQPVRNLFVN